MLLAFAAFCWLQLQRLDFVPLLRFELQSFSEELCSAEADKTHTTPHCSSHLKAIRHEMAVGQNQWYHVGVGAPPILGFFSGDWDVHWGTGFWPMAKSFCKVPAQHTGHHLPAMLACSTETGFNCACNFGDASKRVCTQFTSEACCHLHVQLLQPFDGAVEAPVKNITRL